MKIICRHRQTGRTTELIEECAKYNYAAIVAPNRTRAFSIFKQAKEMGKSIPLPITFNEFIEGEWYGPNIDAFLFDDLDDSIRMIAHGIPLAAAVFKNQEGKDD